MKQRRRIYRHAPAQEVLDSRRRDLCRKVPPRRERGGYRVEETSMR